MFSISFSLGSSLPQANKKKGRVWGSKVGKEKKGKERGGKGKKRRGKREEEQEIGVKKRKTILIVFPSLI